MSVPDPAQTEWLPLWDTGAAGGSAFGSIPGEIRMWSGATLPLATKYGIWVWADGTAYDTVTYPEASANIDPNWKTFGGLADPGAGRFRVPDMRGNTPCGLDQMPAGSAGRANRVTRSVAITLAGRGGEEYHTVTVAEMPSHGHGVSDPTHAHSISDPTHNHPLYSCNIVSGNGVNAWNNNGATGYVWDDARGTGIGIYGAGTGVSVQANGSGGAHETMQPTVFVPWIVRLDG